MKKNIKKNKRKMDLHTHTDHSDGELTPTQLVEIAYCSGIRTLSITDHDNLGGIKNIDWGYLLINGISKEMVELIPGIELSAKVPVGQMHILGYGIDIENKELNDKIKTLRNNSLYGVLSILVQIRKDYGITFSNEDIEKLVNDSLVKNIGRPDVGKLCMDEKYKYAKNMKEAFDKYLIDAYNKTRANYKGIPPEECIKLIRTAGGIPVLAHPKSLDLSEKDFLIKLKELISYGLGGIEVYHSTHSPEDMEYFKTIANKYDLLISGGSDYHGPKVKPDIELGTGRNNNLNIKQLSLVDELHRRK